MRNDSWLLTRLAALALGVMTANAATDEAFARMDGDLLGRFHFVGTARIAADPKAPKLNALAALPETAGVREQFVAKLAAAPFRLLQHKVANRVTNNFAPLLRPLVEDLLSTESYAEMRGPTNQVPEFMLAVLLDNGRAALWQTNLSTILTNWTGIPVKPIQGQGFSGWELKKHHDPNLIRCLRAGDWLLFGWGWEELRLQPEFLQRIREKKRPVEPVKDDWLDVLMDWPAYLAHHPITFPYPLPARLPKMHLTVQARKPDGAGLESFVRPKLTMLFPEPLGLTLDPWRIPTNAIVNPMVSFTALRGFAPWLSQQPEVRNLQAAPLPNQATIWAMSTVPFETRVAIPVNNASNYMAQIAPGLVSLLNSNLSHRAVVSEAVYTNNQVIVADMPFLAPYLRAVRGPTGDFLLAGLFPSAARSNASPVPAGMMRELLSKPNLVYADWELSKERIEQWHGLIQTYLITSGLPLGGGDAPVQKWLEAAKTNLGYCGTEITLSAPNELTLVRNGPIGFTGIELNLLEYWMDAPGFPFHVIYERRRGNGKMPPRH